METGHLNLPSKIHGQELWDGWVSDKLLLEMAIESHEVCNAYVEGRPIRLENIEHLKKSI